MLSGIWYILAALTLMDAFRLRKRLRSIPLLQRANVSPKDEYLALTALGVTLPPGHEAAATKYMQSSRLELLELLPADLGCLAAIRLLQYADEDSTQVRLRTHAAGFGIIISQTLLKRTESILRFNGSSDPLHVSASLRPYALDRVGAAFLPGLRTRSDGFFTDWPPLLTAFSGLARVLFLLQGVMLIVIVTGLYLDWIAGVTLLAAYHLQPVLVFGRTGVRPRDLGRIIAFRSVWELLLWMKLLASRLGSPNQDAVLVEARRPFYDELLRKGEESFFEDRRPDCPVCSGGNLRLWFKTKDLVQSKPGTFRMDECVDCGHIFQNPRLSDLGVKFYYADFYDGLGAATWKDKYRERGAPYRSRARFVEGLANPKRWLDVGTGHGHFCHFARAIWPRTAFEGVDIGNGVDLALQAGWIQAAHHGTLPELSTRMAGVYDVISMFHCLEHVPDPRQDLTAAHRLLSSEGLLVIEVPDPECLFGRLLGRFWHPWFQPQHINMLSLGNLEWLLTEQGYEPLRVQRKEAHTGGEFFTSVGMLLRVLSPKINVPWRPLPSAHQRLRHSLVWSLGFPLIVLSGTLDLLLSPLLGRVGLSNAYRIVARKVATTTSSIPHTEEHSSSNVGAQVR